MAGNGTIRSSEANVQLTVDNVSLGGTFLTIYDLSVKPDAEIVKKRYIGMKRAKGDVVIKGWGLSFKTEKSDHAWMELWDLIQDRELKDQPLPDIVMTITYSYRDGSGRRKVVELSGDLVLLLEDDNYPGEGYQACSWSGFCSYNSSSSAE